MATKTIVRWEPPNEFYSERELLPQTLESLGFFTQRKPLIWRKENGFWLDADEAGISEDLLGRLEGEPFSGGDLGHFKVERQEVPDPETTEVEANADTTAKASTTTKKQTAQTGGQPSVKEAGN